MRYNISSNDIALELGQKVIYGDGSVQSLCRIVNITVQGRPGSYFERVRRIHLEVIQGGRKAYPKGHKFVAKAAERLWVIS